MADVAVEPAGDSGVFRVTVSEGDSQTVHQVTATVADCRRLAPDVDAAELVRESFVFLLEREPKESILRRFDVPVIGRYFPEYEAEIRRRLAR